MSIKVGAAYIRVSTDDQTEYSPDSQLKAIRDHAKHEGYIIPDEFVYKDDGISGKRADKRPAFRMMIATAKDADPPFDTIFVWKYSRFARNQEEAITYKNLLRRKGIEVRSVSEPSSDSPFSSLIERIIEWMDEYYVINLAEEVRRGMKEKVQRGEPTGTAPFGYTVKNKVLTPNENADTVRYIFSQYASGVGCRALAQELGNKGIKTRRGNLPDNRWVKYILENPTYIGKIRWSSNGHANYSRAGHTADNVMIVAGKHSPIIDLKTWNVVQERLQSRESEIKYVRKDKPEIFMLKGLLRCGDCGATLTHLSSATPSLQCHKYAKGQCHVSHSISIRKANAAVIRHLEDLLHSKKFIFTPKKAPTDHVPVRNWDKLIASEENRLRRAKNALLDGVFSSSEYKAEKEEIENNIKKLRDGKASEAKDQEEKIDPEAFRKKLLGILELVKSPDVDEKSKNEALRSMIDKIVYQKPSGTFEVYFYQTL